MTKHVQPSPQSQATLSVLQQAVTKALDRKQRLGHYSVVWQDGAPVMVGGEIDQMELPALLAEMTFLRSHLLDLPSSEKLAKANALVRIGKIEAVIAQRNCAAT